MFKPFSLILIVALLLTGTLAHGQGSLGQIPKQARTLEDYKPSTLRDIVAIDAQDEKLPQGSKESKYSDLIPFRVSVIYTGARRPISDQGKDAVVRWARCCAGNPDQFTKPYDTEIRVKESNIEYWLAVRKQSLPDFEKELKEGQLVNLYLIRVTARRSDGEPGSALLVEKFSVPAESQQ